VRRSAVQPDGRFAMSHLEFTPCAA
jgi:hypothetical protein